MLPAPCGEHRRRPRGDPRRQGRGHQDRHRELLDHQRHRDHWRSIEHGRQGRRGRADRCRGHHRRCGKADRWPSMPLSALIIDAIALAAGKIALTMFGGAGEDTLGGSAGNDPVSATRATTPLSWARATTRSSGTSGDDNDTVEGQAGFDTLRFTAPTSSTLSASRPMAGASCSRQAGATPSWTSTIRTDRVQGPGRPGPSICRGPLGHRFKQVAIDLATPAALP